MLTEWLLLLLILFSAAGCFGGIVMASVHRREKPNRFARAAWVCGGCFALFVAVLPVYTQSHYMFIQEPFVDAARDGKLSEVKSLLAQGALIDTEADDGRGTALVAAAAEGHADIVQYLIAHRVNVNVKADYFGEGYDDARVISPLQAAAKHPNVAALLRRAGAKK